MLTLSMGTPSCLGSAQPVPARRTWPWRRRYRLCSAKRSAGLSSLDPRSKPESGSDSYPQPPPPKINPIFSPPPGPLTDKIAPYLRPLYDALNDMMDPEMVPKLLAAGTVEVAPLAYMRGRTLNDSFVV